ncbi:MAG: hypothetical protein EA428_02265 [Spirochaetaceae bacterium]|nr:MAG: hypothetical protein EA428_02265 [Spirochaetaceae bacterium]
MPAAAWGGGFPNILVIFALSGFFALSSCGLDVVPFLYPPESPSAIGSGLQFLHDTRNNDTPQSDNFRGYEIYYKFYDFSGVNGETQLQNDRNAIEADPIPPGTARLTARNYRRLRSLRNDGSLETRLPLIPVSIGSAPSIQLLFSGSVGVEGAFVLRNNNEADAARLVRAVDDADANPRLFYGLDQYATNHADIPNTINLLTDSAALRIAFYAVAYGVQPDFRPLYSIPIFLANEIPLDFQ